MKKIILLAICVGCLPALELKAQSSQTPDSNAFSKTIDGKQAGLFLLRNKTGMTVALSNFGARIVSIIVPAKDGNSLDVALGFDSVASYQKRSNQIFGATVGRFANRIAHASFAIDGVEYKLEANNGKNSIHGGNEGFARKVWDVEKPTGSQVTFTYRAADGEGGFPGNLTTKVTYSLTEGNALQIDYEAVTDKKTVINLTNHNYFNLNGAGGAPVTDHLLTMNASQFTPADSFSIPTGSVQTVHGTPFDFRQPTLIGARINDEYLKLTRGYDHNYVLGGAGSLKSAAIVQSISTGILMKVFTTEPGVQFYTANSLRATEQIGKGGHGYGQYGGFCLETQHYPDSPNKPDFPSTVLPPGQTFKSRTVYRFEVVK